MFVLGSPMVVMLLFHLVELASSFPSYLVKPSVFLNDFIKHYEPAFYDAKEVSNQHKRIRRATSAKDKNNQPLKLTISTTNKVFKLVLRPDDYLFSDDVIFEGENGKIIDFDRGKAYIGSLEDDERTKVRGIITKDGLFDGTISTQFEEFYIEPVNRYKPSSGSEATHTIMYKISDVTHPSTPLCASLNLHAKRKPSDLNTIAYRSKRTVKEITNAERFSSNIYDELLRDDEDSNESPSWNERVRSKDSWSKLRDNFEQRSFHQSYRHIPIFHDFPSTFESHSQSPSPMLDSRAARSKIIRQSATTTSPSPQQQQQRQQPQSKDSGHIYYDFDLATIENGVRKHVDEEDRHYESNDSISVNETVHQFNSKHWRPKSGLIDTVYKYTNTSKNSKGYLPPSGILHKSNSKILIGSGMEESRANLIVTNEDSPEQHARKRAIVDPKKTTCMLYLQADHLFFEKYGTEETCIEVMTRHVQRVNSIYRNTDFNQDGKPDNISFMIKRIKVHSNKDPSYRFPGNYGVEKFLEIFSEEDYDAFCLAYMFTYRDFEMGTLGLAWTGDLKNAGGVCEKNGHYRGSLKSLNTGIVTVLNYGKHVPSAVSHVTLAHEIGHNFGSPHDPEGCTPGGDDGNFIMFARATSGDKKNNNRFSPCSLNAINPVLNVKARSSKGCFTEPQTSICGNGVVEPDEECDCGWEEDCKDACCYPQRRYPPLDEPPCRLTPNAVCSPSQGPCCTTECKIKSGDICRSDNGCRDSSYCNGVSPQCPPSINKPNKTVCNEEYVCYMGECTGSICLAYGLESCQCIPTPSDLPTKACELCCKLPGENQPCLSSFQWNEAPYDVPDMFAKPGTPCNDYNGYCDVFRKCREVDPSGPIATLRKLLLSEENIASFKRWAYEHWYYCGVIFFTFLLFMVISTKVLSKKPKIKSVTVVHSSPTETVRLPTDGSGGPAVVVHPIVVRAKLPLKKKVRENKRRNNKSSHQNQGDETVANHVNNDDAAIESKNKKKRNPVDVKVNLKCKKSKSPPKNVKTDVKFAQPKAGPNSAPEDPLGKVRNWLINSHHMSGVGSLKKSKSSPAGFDLSEANGTKKRHKPLPNVANAEANATKIGAKKAKDTRVKLQVVYKPPFKFSVKLGKHKNEISSQLIKDKRPEAVKQRAALLIRADRVRANNVTKSAKIDSENFKTWTKKHEHEHEPEPDDVENTKTPRPECKRSISAPQPEPVYENTMFEAIAPRNDEKPTIEEPQYVNICEPVAKFDGICDSRKSRIARDTYEGWPFAVAVADDDGDGDGGNAVSKSTEMKRATCNLTRDSLSKPSNVSVAKSLAKRRNSCDTRPSFESSVRVKRQFSDETDLTNASARHEFKRKSCSVKRTNSADVKSANSSSRPHTRKTSSTRKSYRDHSAHHPFDKTKSPPEIETRRVPSFSRSSKCDEIGGDESATIDRNIETHLSSSIDNKMKDSSMFIKRTASHSNERKNEGDKFKRYSLQGVDSSALPQFSGMPKKSFPRSALVTQEQAPEIPFQHLQYDIPSDLEVLLSETENPTES